MGFTQYFLNPAFVPAGLALVASPIIIHLINRMRFRKVRFAAMEFLLQAQQRNRRRLLLEQLLLLLLRILIVLALLALIARLVLDPRLSVFGGNEKAHHLVILDDSASMQNRWGSTSAFEEAKKVILELAREGARHPQTQTFSLVLLSKPTDFLFAEVDVSEELVRDLEEKLEPGTLRASYTRPDLQAALETAGRQLQKQQATIKHLHVFSDFRRPDWQGNEALAQTITMLEEDGISVNLVRSVEQPLPNLGITTLDGDLHSVAAGVPVRFRIGVTNFGDKVVENQEVSVIVDGEKLPLSITFPKIEASQEVVLYKDITFATEGLHRLQVQLRDDSLNADNSRYLSVDIPKQNYVLIVTSDTTGDAAFALEAALAPSLELTGIATNVVQSDFLEKELADKELRQFRAIYMVNVPDVPAQSLEMLESYVRGGGGLVWFLGDKVRVDAYNRLSKLQPNEAGQLARPEDEDALFPVLLNRTPKPMPADPTVNTPDLNFVSHPIFDDTFNKDNPVITQLSVKQFIPVSEDWVRDDSQRKDGVTTVGFTREGDPVVFDHRFGNGRVMTFLTSAGPPWNNLVEIGGLYIPLVHKMQQYVAKPDEEKHIHEIGEALAIGGISAVDYEGKIYWTRPGDLSEIPVDMSHPGPASDRDNTTWQTEYDELNTPGIYRYRLVPRSNRQGADLPTQWEFAVNVAPEEGRMATATDEEIREHLGEESRVAIHEYGDKDFIGAGTDPGQEVRRYLMYFLLFLLVAEQAMAYRLSYHPETVEAPA